MDPSQVSHSAAALVMDPRVETAIWAIFAAVGFALILILSEMVKNRK